MKNTTYAAALWLPLCSTLACSSTEMDVGDEPVDTDDAIVQIHFPPPVVATPETTVRMRGTASDADGIHAIWIGQTTAVTTDGYANWYADVPLQSGVNEFEIEAEDLLGNRYSIDIRTVHAQPVQLFGTRAIALSDTGDRLFAFSERVGFVSINARTGERTVVSSYFDGDINDIGNYVILPLTWDPVGGRLLALRLNGDQGGDFLTVDPVTGERALLADSGAGPAIDWPVDATWDPVDERILVTQRSPLTAIVAIDPVTDNRSIAYDMSAGEGPVPGGPLSLAIEPESGRIFLFDSERDAFYELDRDTGARTLISGDGVGSGPTIEAGAISWDATNEQLLVIDRVQDQLFTVNVETGLRTRVGPVKNQWKVPWDPYHERAIVIDHGIKLLNIETGQRGPLSVLEAGYGPVFEPQAVAGGRIGAQGPVVLADLCGDRVIAVDSWSGMRRPLAESGDGRGPDLRCIRSLHVDNDNRRIFIMDTDETGQDGRRVVMLDIDTEERIISIDENDWCTGWGFHAEMVFVPTTNEMVVAIAEKETSDTSIFDLDTGACRVSPLGFSGTDPLLWDGQGERILEITSARSVYASDPVTETREFLYSHDDPFADIFSSVIVDESANELLSLTPEFSLINFGLDTLQPRVVIESRTDFNVQMADTDRESALLAWNRDRGVAWFIQDDGIVIMDAQTGERVLLSR